MKTLQFTTDISAPKEKVWKVLWDDDTYPKWASVFMEGSYAVTDPPGEWKEGSKVLFLSPNPNGEGMSSLIDKNIPNEYMAFKHMGMVKDGKEVPPDETTQSWSGAIETYKLEENDGVTKLTINLDATDEFREYFEGTFPKAVGKIKELSES